LNVLCSIVRVSRLRTISLDSSRCGEGDDAIRESGKLNLNWDNFI